MPPALDMAAQSLGLQSHIMAPHMMGYLTPNISVMTVFIFLPPLISFVISKILNAV
jgi:hypothetical protein